MGPPKFVQPFSKKKGKNKRRVCPGQVLMQCPINAYFVCKEWRTSGLWKFNNKGRLLGFMPSIASGFLPLVSFHYSCSTLFPWIYSHALSTSYVFLSHFYMKKDSKLCRMGWILAFLPHGRLNQKYFKALDEMVTNIHKSN